MPDTVVVVVMHIKRVAVTTNAVHINMVPVALVTNAVNIRIPYVVKAIAVHCHTNIAVVPVVVLIHIPHAVTGNIVVKLVDIAV